MTRYCFNWSIAGSTIIEAESLNAAQDIFNDMSAEQMEEDGNSEFSQHEILVETAPGVFEDTGDVEDTGDA